MPEVDVTREVVVVLAGSVKKDGGRLRCLRGGFLALSPLTGSLTELKRAARLLVWRLACSPSRLWTGLPCWVWVWVGKPEIFLLLAPGAAAGFPVGLMKPVHLLICFCRYLRWLTFLLDLTGLSKASLMLLEAESMKLSRFLVVSLYSPLSSLSSSGLPSRLLVVSLYSPLSSLSSMASPSASAAAANPKYKEPLPRHSMSSCPVGLGNVGTYKKQIRYSISDCHKRLVPG
uniref:Uncharacterized protein n=1 Tax=Oncorhynchus mykiss TaxID=8022 RepID=A0A8C7TTU3_ONCMY